MDRLWTPWRYNYVTGGDERPDGLTRRKGVPADLEAWPGEDAGCVFCNLIRAVEWGIASGLGVDKSEQAGLIVARWKTCYVCLNAFPYNSGHVMVVPYEHADSLAKLPARTAEEMMRGAQRVETGLREVYQPNGINLGLNLGQAAGAGVAEHLHLHVVPRWFGDTNFMTVTAETRVLPEALTVTWERLREVLGRQGPV